MDWPRLIFGTRPTLALPEAYRTRLVMRLGREPSSYPLDLSNASESGGQSLSRAMRVFSAYSAY